MRGVRLAVLIILTLVLPPFRQPAAAGTTCPGDKGTTKLSVKRINGKISYKTGNTRSDLERIRQRHGATGAAVNGFPLGLTLSELRVEMRISTRAYPTSRGRYCSVPDRVNIDFGYPRFTIYIDRRYRRESCEYRAISEHEERHVAIYRQQLDRLIYRVRKNMARAISRMAPLITASPNNGAERIKRRLSIKLAPLIRELQRATDIGNRRIDSKINYIRVQGRCRNW